eukprot:GILJ01012520.1.p1 GENE.GILJ01012520.1~~GILJ01012520.1.p1  ORF type:complete len:445 (+),score=69.49 GILJ01012520.1:27-1337(+)
MQALLLQAQSDQEDAKELILASHGVKEALSNRVDELQLQVEQHIAEKEEAENKCLLLTDKIRFVEDQSRRMANKLKDELIGKDKSILSLQKGLRTQTILTRKQLARFEQQLSKVRKSTRSKSESESSFSGIDSLATSPDDDCPDCIHLRAVLEERDTLIESIQTELQETRFIHLGLYDEIDRMKKEQAETVSQLNQFRLEVESLRRDKQYTEALLNDANTKLRLAEKVYPIELESGVESATMSRPYGSFSWTNVPRSNPVTVSGHSPNVGDSHPDSSHIISTQSCVSSMHNMSASITSLRQTLKSELFGTTPPSSAHQHQPIPSSRLSHESAESSMINHKSPSRFTAALREAQVQLALAFQTPRRESLSHAGQQRQEQISEETEVQEEDVAPKHASTRYSHHEDRHSSNRSSPLVFELEGDAEPSSNSLGSLAHLI